jgi:hypothetical protein
VPEKTVLLKENFAWFPVVRNFASGGPSEIFSLKRAEAFFRTTCDKKFFVIDF